MAATLESEKKFATANRSSKIAKKKNFFDKNIEKFLQKNDFSRFCFLW